MNGKKLLLIGGGGHCLSVYDSLTDYGDVGVVEKDSESMKCSPLRVVGTDHDLLELLSSGWTDAFITVGSIGDTTLRRKLYVMVKQIGFHIPVIIDPSAIVGSNVKMGEGCYVGKGAVINSYSVIGNCAIINTGAIIEHECRIGHFSHISPGVILCGNVAIGDDVHIGAGTVIRQGLSVGNAAMIGMGSTVVKDISGSTKAYGNPCRVID